MDLPVGCQLDPMALLVLVARHQFAIRGTQKYLQAFPKAASGGYRGLPTSLANFIPPNPPKTLPNGTITVGPFLELSPVALAPVGVGTPELQPLLQPL